MKDVINDLSTLIRLMELGGKPKHSDDGWKMEQADRQTGQPVLVDVSTFAITQAKKFNCVEVVKMEGGYEARLVAPSVVETNEYPVLSDDLSNLYCPARLRALSQTGLFGSAPTEDFDRLTRLACSVLKCPVGLITLVSTDKQFFKSQFGLGQVIGDVRCTSTSDSLCKYVVANEKELIVCEAHSHPLVKNIPIVHQMDIHAYAGFPIRSTDGQVIGAFCLIDFKPRHWMKSELELLKHFAGLANLCIEAAEMRMQIAAMTLPPLSASKLQSAWN